MFTKQMSLLLTVVLCGTAELHLVAAARLGENPSGGVSRERRLSSPSSRSSPPPLFVFCDIGGNELGLINYETDQIIQVPLKEVSGWPFPDASANTQHAWVTPDGKKIYVSTVALASKSEAAIVAFTYRSIKWDKGKIQGLSVDATLTLDAAGTPSAFPDGLSQVTPDQPIDASNDWASPSYTQIHGPTFRPGTTLSYHGTWTDDQMVVFDTKTNEFVDCDPSFRAGDFSLFTHGFFFNEAGTSALGAGYWFDRTFVSLYKFSDGAVFPDEVTKIQLKGDADECYGAFAHYVTWLDNRYAYTVTMQFAETSLSKGKCIDSPGIYLIDSKEKTATRIIGTAKDQDDTGVLRSGSDLVIANGKLYIAEEDTLEGRYDATSDGHISVFSIRSDKRLEFVKRFSPSGELPDDFKVAHGNAPTPDGRFVFVSSYFSNYIVKIDTEMDAIAKIWTKMQDGLSAPHGGFVAGNIR